MDKVRDAISRSRLLDRVLTATDKVQALQPLREWRDARDYARVNGSADAAREAEVKMHGSRGYQGAPSIDAAERRADRMGDATGSWKGQQEEAAWGKVEAAGGAMRQPDQAQGQKVAKRQGMTV